MAQLVPCASRILGLWLVWLREGTSHLVYLMSRNLSRHMWLVAAILVRGVLETSCTVVTVRSVTGRVAPSFWGKVGRVEGGRRSKRGRLMVIRRWMSQEEPSFFFEGFEELIKILDLRNNLVSGEKQRTVWAGEWTGGSLGGQLLSYSNQNSLWGIFVQTRYYCTNPGKK